MVLHLLSVCVCELLLSMEQSCATFSLDQGETKSVLQLFMGRCAKCRNYHIYVLSMGTMFFIREVHVQGCMDINIQGRADSE